MTKTEAQKKKDREYSKQWRKDNPEKVTAYKEVRNKMFPEKVKQQRRLGQDKFLFDGNRELALERDGWICQECGMSQEKCIVMFNRGLSVHHKDETGLNVPKEEKNNDLDNLVTMCTRCHNLLHRKINKKRIFGDLLEQDDSEWKYPRLRYVLDKKKTKLGTITKAKEELGEELGVSYHGIDHMYYQRKETLSHGSGNSGVKE